MNKGRPTNKKIAYFSMEVAIDPKLPTYSGGLGVLAGDTLRSAADLGLPVIGITMLHRKGYFKQQIDVSGKQKETPVLWNPEDDLIPIDHEVSVTIANRKVNIKTWRYDIKGIGGHIVPIYFLDTKVASNDKYDKSLSDQLYGGDNEYRLCQEIVLGIGGVLLLKELGFPPQGLSTTDLCIETYHMNEGHSALLTLALLIQNLGPRKITSCTEADFKFVRDLCIFTTHTPVSAGHDKFEPNLVYQILGKDIYKLAHLIGACPKEDQEALNMTHLALNLSRYVNGVAKRHGEVSRAMLPGHDIHSITNGVHAEFWTSDPFRALFDRVVPEWRRDNFYLRYMGDVAISEILSAHREAKRILFKEVQRQTSRKFNESVFTIGFARRLAGYKRADLILSDVERLKRIAEKVGGIQVIYAGKSHPKDERGKALLKKVYTGMARLRGSKISVVYLEDYGMDLGRLICGGVDLWLNNPVKPLEASGTSGMKAALNGVPSLSTLDGWWVEGHEEGITGWEIEDPENAFGADESKDRLSRATAASSLYDKLEWVIMPLFYGDPLGYGKIMRNAIALNGSFFTTQRMVQQYTTAAYYPNK